MCGGGECIFTACGSDDDDPVVVPAETVVSTLAADTAVGSKITIKDDAGTAVDYYVISNTLGASSASANVASRSAADGSSRAVTTGDTERDAVVEKFASDVYVRKFLAEAGITQYVQLWASSQNKKDPNATASNGTVQFNDDFPIYNAELTKIANFRQSWVSEDLVKSLNSRGITGYTDIDTSSKSAMSDAFNKISEYDLRIKYEPNQFKVDTFPTDVTKKLSLKREYNYDSNGEVALTKANCKQEDVTENYQSITVNGEAKAWAPTTYKLYETDKRYLYTLSGTVKLSTGAQWGDFDNRDPTSSRAYRQIHCDVKGAPFADTGANNNGEFYKNEVRLQFPSDGKKTPNIQVTVSGTSVDDANKVTYTIESVELSTETTLLNATVTVKDASGNAIENLSNVTLKAALESSYLKDYIRIPDQSVEANKTTLNGIIVPQKIYIRAKYQDDTASAALNKDFLDVTLVPDEDITTGIVYKEINRTNEDDSGDIPAHVKIYADNLQTIANGTYATTSTIFTDE